MISGALDALIPTRTSGAEIAAAGVVGALGTLAVQRVIRNYVQSNWQVRTHDNVELDFTAETISLIELFQAHCPGPTARMLPNFEEGGAPSTSMFRPTVSRVISLPRLEGQESTVNHTYNRYVSDFITQLEQYESTRAISIFHGQTVSEFKANGRRKIKNHRVLFNQVFTIELIRVLSLQSFDSQTQGLLNLVQFCTAIKANNLPNLKKTRDNIHDETEMARTFNVHLIHLIRNLRSKVMKITEDRDKVLFKTAIEESHGYIDPILNKLTANLTAALFPSETERKSDINIFGIVKYDEAESDPSIRIEYRKWFGKCAYKAAVLCGLRATMTLQSLRFHKGSIADFLWAQMNTGYYAYLSQNDGEDIESEVMRNPLYSSKQKCVYLIRKALLENAGFASSKADRETNAQKAAEIIFALLELTKKLEIFEEIAKIMRSFVTLQGESVIIGAPALVRFFGAHFKATCQLISNLQASFQSLKSPLAVVNNSLLASPGRRLAACQEHIALFDRLESRSLGDNIAAFAASSDLLEKSITPGHLQSVRADLHQNLVQLYDYAFTMGATATVMDELKEFTGSAPPQRLLQDTRFIVPDDIIVLNPVARPTEPALVFLYDGLCECASQRILKLRVRREASGVMLSAAQSMIAETNSELLAEIYLDNSAFGLSDLSPINPEKLQLIWDKYWRGNANFRSAIVAILPSIQEGSLQGDFLKMPITKRIELHALLSNKSVDQINREIRLIPVESITPQVVKKLWKDHLKQKFDENKTVMAELKKERLHEQQELIARNTQRCVENLEIIKDTLLAMLSAYVSSTKTAGWFHRHGKGGIDRVKAIRDKIDKLGRTPALFTQCLRVAGNNHDLAYQVAIEQLHEGIILDVNGAEGNLHDHSLKSYVLSYTAWAAEVSFPADVGHQWERVIHRLTAEQVNERLAHYCLATPKDRRAQNLGRVAQVFGVRYQQPVLAAGLDVAMV